MFFVWVTGEDRSLTGVFLSEVSLTSGSHDVTFRDHESGERSSGERSRPCPMTGTPAHPQNTRFSCQAPTAARPRHLMTLLFISTANISRSFYQWRKLSRSKVTAHPANCFEYNELKLYCHCWVLSSLHSSTPPFLPIPSLSPSFLIPCLFLSSAPPPPSITCFSVNSSETVLRTQTEVNKV